MHFPDTAIEILRQACWEPKAHRSYDLLAGGFMWSDEGFDEVLHVCEEGYVGPFRCVLAYRASLIRGEPRNELQEAWDQLLAACPSWPGFRAERTGCSLEEELDAEKDDSLKQLEHMLEVDERAQRINAIREKLKRK